jgi:transposase-like protein
LARALGVTQKTAWFMLHRIRLAMQAETFEKIDGEVEVDETFIGGKARNMHREKRARVIKGSTGMVGKVAVAGLLDRNAPEGSQVRLRVVPNTRRHHLSAHIWGNVEVGSTIFSDALPSYAGLDRQYIHNVIDHAEKYAEGNVHTNGLENFWSLLKRAIRGTYVSVEPFHLFRYLDEQAFRFNNRNDTDGGRFLNVLRCIVGKRVTYAELTGAEMAVS